MRMISKFSFSQIHFCQNKHTEKKLSGYSTISHALPTKKNYFGQEEVAKKSSCL